MVVSWSKPTGASISDYTVNWIADNQNAYKQKLVTTTKATLDVVPYTYYTIKVRARNKIGVGNWSIPIRQRSDEAGKTVNDIKILH